jgi:hypothetical protein
MDCAIPFQTMVPLPQPNPQKLLSKTAFSYLEEIMEESDDGSDLELTESGMTLCKPSTIEPETTTVTWSLQFHRQNMAEFVSMTNGLDPAMQLGFSIRISLPERRRSRSRSLFDIFKSHDTDDHDRRSGRSIFTSQTKYDHYDPHDKVTVDIELPVDLEAVYTPKIDGPRQISKERRFGTTLFDLSIGRLRDIYVRTSLWTLVQDYYFRPTLLSAMQVPVVGGSRKERLILCTIYYLPLLDITSKLDYINRHSGVWVKIGRWYKPLPGKSISKKDVEARPWLVVAMLSASLYRALRKDPQVKRVVTEPSYLESKREDAKVWYGAVFSGMPHA